MKERQSMMTSESCNPTEARCGPVVFYLAATARVLMGLLFLVTGLNGFFDFLPQPESMPEGAAAFAGALMQTGYMFPLIMGTQLLAGVLLLLNRFVPLALVLIAPIIVNIVAFHVFLEPSGLGMAGFVAALELLLVWAYWDAYRPMFAMRMSLRHMREPSGVRKESGSMLVNILMVVAVLLVVFLVIVAMRPAEFRVTRSATIAAPAEAVFAHVNDLRKWDAWSPWAKLDPNEKKSIEGPSAGEGTICRWDGNKKVGAGSMTLIQSRPNELITLRLDFLRPFKATCTQQFEFRSAGDETMVTWTMAGQNNFMGKLMSLFMDCDKIAGGQFDQGLAQLKDVVEAEAKPATVRPN